MSSGGLSRAVLTCLDQALPSRPAYLKTAPLLIALLLGVYPAAAQADQVVSVGDGDTLSVMRGGRRVIVRLACIDAPESRQQPYGTQARSALQQLAPIGSEVSLAGADDRGERSSASD